VPRLRRSNRSVKEFQRRRRHIGARQVKGGRVGAERAGKWTFPKPGQAAGPPPPPKRTAHGTPNRATENVQNNSPRGSIKMNRGTEWSPRDISVWFTLLCVAILLSVRHFFLDDLSFTMGAAEAITLSFLTGLVLLAWDLTLTVAAAGWAGLALINGFTGLCFFTSTI